MAKRIMITWGNKKRWCISPALLFMALFYFLFAILDMQTSTQTGNKGADRTRTHMALLLFTGYMIAYALLHIRKIKMTRTLLPLILLAIWIFFSGMINQAETWNLLVQMNMSVLWILSYLFFYDYMKRGKIEKRAILRFSRFVLLFYCGATIFYSLYALQKYGHFTAMNIIYYALAIFPWTLTEEKGKKFFYICIFIATFISLKRGAIIVLPAMYIIETLLSPGNRKDAVRKIAVLSGLLLALVIAFFVVNEYTDGYMVQRFSAEELATGSGRMNYYQIALNAIQKRNFIQFIIGGGIGSSVDLLGTGVHNEWLEMLFSFGLIGLLIYMCFILGILTRTVQIYRINKRLGAVAAMSTVLYLVLSLVSTGYGGYSGVFLFGFWGYIESLAEESGDYRCAITRTPLEF